MKNILLTAVILVVCLVPKFAEGQSLNEDGEGEAFQPIKCYECGGANGKCNDPTDRGIEKTCGTETQVCVIATDDEGAVYRRCDTQDEFREYCVNDGMFCYCLGDLCNSTPPLRRLPWLVTTLIVLGIRKIL